MGILGLFKKKEKPQKTHHEPKQKEIKKSPYEQLCDLMIANPDINLKKDEVCFYQGKAQSCKKKKVVTGYKGGGSGVSVRLAKGLSVHTGGNSKQAIRETISEKYPANLYITNQRIILLSEKYGFTVSFPSILQLERHSDGFIVHQASKTNLVLSSDVDKIFHVFSLMNEMQQQK